MGSGGGYTRIHSGGGGSSIAELENIAREQISKKITTRKKIFLSFRGKDKNLVDLFRGQAKNENSELAFIDLSLKTPFDSDDAEYIKRGIRERISQSSVTLVLITDSAHESKWIDWEIRETIRQGKGLVGVKLSKDPNVKIPKALTEHRKPVVDWDHQKINDSIESESR